MPAGWSFLSDVPGDMGLMAWMIATALADKAISAKERTLLRKVAAKHAIPPRAMDAMLDAAERGELKPLEPRDRDEGRRWLEAMADAALIDGRIAPEETRLLKAAGAKIGLVDYDINLLVTKRRAELYRQARDELHAQKRSDA